MVKRHVQTVKRIKKAYFDQKDPYLALLELNNTPISTEIHSPNRILLGRNIRGIMPGRLIQKDWERNDIKKALENRQLNKKRFHDSKGPAQIQKRTEC